jgi:hypothetical protein
LVWPGLTGPSLLLAVAGLPLCVLPRLQAQDNTTFMPTTFMPGVLVPEQARGLQGIWLTDRLPGKPSLPPVLSIAVGPLGFSAPGPIYLGQRNCMASLDFLDEDRLLFTFRVPGLMHREPGDKAGETAWGNERRIRAVVLALKTGTAESTVEAKVEAKVEATIEAEALWTVHDRVRYLWMLKGGRFLLRDQDGLQQGDATLELKPLLRFPGPLLWLELDPNEQFLVADSHEPVATKPDQDAGPAKANPVATGAGKAAAGEKPPNQNQKPESEKPDSQADFVVRILRRESGKVVLVSRARSTVHLPINSDGYLESLRGNGRQWLLNLNYFSGGSTNLGRVDSDCSPAVDFISQGEVLVAACAGTDGRKLVAMSTDGRRLWEDSASAAAIWPLLVRSPDGSRLAWETLAVTHAVNAYAPLDREDIKGQLVRVLNAADGKVVLESPASPVLDAGGNVAISPSGQRVAVLNAGALQVFDLPAPPPLADSAGKQTPR